MLSRLRKADKDYFGRFVGEGSAITAVTAVLVGVMPIGFLMSRVRGNEDQYDGDVEMLLDRML